MKNQNFPKSTETEKENEVKRYIVSENSVEVINKVFCNRLTSKLLKIAIFEFFVSLYKI